MNIVKGFMELALMVRSKPVYIIMVTTKKEMNMGSKKKTATKKALNGNTLAQEIAKMEGGKHQVNLGQTKEILKNLSVLFVKNPLEVMAILKRIGERNLK